MRTSFGILHRMILILSLHNLHIYAIRFMKLWTYTDSVSHRFLGECDDYSAHIATPPAGRFPKLVLQVFFYIDEIITGYEADQLACDVDRTGITLKHVENDDDNHDDDEENEEEEDEGDGIKYCRIYTHTENVRKTHENYLNASLLQVIGFRN